MENVYLVNLDITYLIIIASLVQIIVDRLAYQKINVIIILLMDYYLKTGNVIHVSKNSMAVKATLVSWENELNFSKTLKLM